MGVVAPIFVYGGKTMRLEEEVLLVNKGTKKFESKWDGKTFTLAKGKDKQVARGLAEHFINKHPKAKLEIQEIEDEEPESREVEGENTEQANAFEELGD